MITQKELRELNQKDFDRFIATFDMNSKKLKHKSIVLTKILEFRPDIQLVSKDWYNRGFIYNAYINNIIDMELVLAQWDYNGRIIENQANSISDLYNTPICNSAKYAYSFIKNKSPFITYLYSRGVDLVMPELLNLDRTEYLDIIKPILCKNCNIPIHRKDYKLERSTCSQECVSELSSKRMKIDNPNQKMNDKQKQKKRENQSIEMKSRILSGKFTPCVTNSWCKSRVYINNIPTRSSWEGLFLLFNPALSFESVRIPYELDGKIRTYIVDFEDSANKILYEIKPISEMLVNKNIAKFKAAENWCKENSYEYVIIEDTWFISRIDDLVEIVGVLETDDDSKRKLLNSLNNFIKMKVSNG